MHIYTHKLGKEYIKAVYCHSVYLTYVQSTLCEMADWMNHKWNEASKETPGQDADALRRGAGSWPPGIQLLWQGREYPQAAWYRYAGS